MKTTEKLDKPAGLDMWTVYKHPEDYPEHYVVRQWTVRADGMAAGAALLADTLEQARELVPPHSYRLDRHPDDEPCIVEVWL